MGDLHRFDSDKLAWENCSEAAGAAPIAREGHGFAAVPGGRIYLFGGNSSHGDSLFPLPMVIPISLSPSFAHGPRPFPRISTHPATRRARPLFLKG
jgi:hypothetical protein